MMGEFNALTSGGLTSFTQLVDGAERYENYINTGPNPNQKSLGYDQKKALKSMDDDNPLQINAKSLTNQQPEVKKNKLSSLNQYIGNNLL